MLSTEDKLPFLEQPIPTLPVLSEGQANPLDVLTTHQAWVKAQKEIVGLMLMTMDPDIQNNLEHLADQELLQTVREFHACKQEEGQYVSSYVLKIKSYIDNLERLGHAMTQNLSVSLILVSLRKEYDGFVQNYYMHSMRKIVNELHALLKLHEQTLPPKEVAPTLHAIRAPPFALKPKNPLTPKKDNPAKDAICHQCGEGLRGSRKLKPGVLSLYMGDGHRAAVEAIGDFHLCLPIWGSRVKPANYKAALLDPKSDKWLNAMNVEMQSMKDNEVWELVELPPVAKTIGHKWLFKKKTNMDGAVHTYKARLVAKGFTQTPGIDYEEIFFLLQTLELLGFL
ncbi:zinc finger, CCHC-type containing protein [Tanacetum coccineum]